MTAAVLARRFGERGAAIARRVDNPFLDALVKRVRLDRPEQWIEKRGATAKALARLRAGGCCLLVLPPLPRWVGRESPGSGCSPRPWRRAFRATPDLSGK